MKQILEPGKYNTLTCSDCGCKFTFDKSDLDENNQTTCPCCDKLLKATVKV